MTNLDSILKSRDTTLWTKVGLVKAMLFPVVMYGYESWTIKKAEHQRTDAFELWCLRRLLRIPWTARRSNQSILKEISPGCSLEGLMLKLKLQYFGEGLTHWKRPWCWERLRAGEGNDRGWDDWMASVTQWTCVWMDSGIWWWTGRPDVLGFMGLQRVGHDWVTQLSWTDVRKRKTNTYIKAYILNLERWCWWTYLQDSNEHVGIENWLLDMVGEEEGGTNWESSIETRTSPYAKLDSWWKFIVWQREIKPSSLWQPRGVGWIGRWEGVPKGRRQIHRYGWFMLIYVRK